MNSILRNLNESIFMIKRFKHVGTICISFVYMITDEVCSPVPWKNISLERLSDFQFTLYVDILSKNNDFTGVCVSFAFNFSHLSDLCLWTIIYILPFFLSSLSNLETWYFWMRFVGSILPIYFVSLNASEFFMKIKLCWLGQKHVLDSIMTDLAVFWIINQKVERDVTIFHSEMKVHKV